jgi:hypothetical protein
LEIEDVAAQYSGVSWKKNAKCQSSKRANLKAKKPPGILSNNECRISNKKYLPPSLDSAFEKGRRV